MRNEIKSLIFIFLLCFSGTASTGTDENDLAIVVNFSGAENGIHMGTTGIMSITVTNNGVSDGDGIHVSGFYIDSLSGEYASPYFMIITENLDQRCDFMIHFHIDPVPDWWNFLRVEFPEIPAYQSFTCQFRYRFLIEDTITSSYYVNQTSNIDPIPENNRHQITLLGFTQLVPINSAWMLTVFMVFILLFTSRKLSC